MERFIYKAKLWIIDLFRRLSYKKHHRVAKILARFMEYVMPQQVAEPEVPQEVIAALLEKRIAEWKSNIEAHLKSRNKNRAIDIGFGDSMLDLARENYVFLKSKFNFGVAGAYHVQMRYVIEALYPLLKQCNIRSVTIGTIEGNALAAGRDVNISIKNALDLLSFIRGLFPQARIMSYGIPPIYNIHATMASFRYETTIYEKFVLRDGNAVFIPLQKGFAKNEGDWITPDPDIENSSDGTHFTAVGAGKFDDCLTKGVDAPAGSVVNP